MGTTTFSGPLISNNGIFNQGDTSVPTISTSLIVNPTDHGGKISKITATTGTIQVPEIMTGTGSNVGVTYTFFLAQNVSNLSIQVNGGTDHMIGSIVASNNRILGAVHVWEPDADDFGFNMNGTTKGGIRGTQFSLTAIDDAEYLLHNAVLLGNGTLIDPFFSS